MIKLLLILLVALVLVSGRSPVLVRSKRSYDSPKPIYTASTHEIVKFYKSSRRICMTAPNCDCRVATQKESVSQCRTRCQRSRRCYRMTCENPGANYCQRISTKQCTTRFPNNLFKQQQCLKDSSSCCQKRELAKCRKARRLFRFRSECTAKARLDCGSNDDKCACAVKSRRSCISKKTVEYRSLVRSFFPCSESARMLCASRACSGTYDKCVSREKKQCQPACEVEARKQCKGVSNGPCFEQKKVQCTKQWKDFFCLFQAIALCDLDQDCYKPTVKECVRTQSKCMKKSNKNICDDGNACTEDICDPILGCIYKDKICKTAGNCKTATCHKKLGCVYKQKACTKSTKTCFENKCEETTGQCKQTFNKNLAPAVCSNTVSCTKDTECQSWVSAKYPKTCRTGFCDVNQGICITKIKLDCAQNCQQTCVPTNECEKAECVREKGIYKCVRTAKKCLSRVPTCFNSSCVPKQGCVQTKKTTPECSTPVCKAHGDCKQWGIQQGCASACLKAQCNVVSGVCEKVVDTTQKCVIQRCNQACKPSHRCETAQCKQVSTSSFQCVRTPTLCNDNNRCTTDRCDVNSGKCVFTRKSKFCQVCNFTKDCLGWAAANKKDPKSVSCLAGTCYAKPCENTCTEVCKASSPCKVSKCEFNNVTKTSSCVERDFSCDDKNTCTKDWCEVQNGIPVCRNQYVPSLDCVPCDLDIHCAKLSVQKNLCENCQKSVCNKALKTCVVVPKSKPCQTLQQCQQSCAQKTTGCSSSQCRKVGCSYVCSKVTKDCNDNKCCTLDFCDEKTGKCVNKFVKSEKCTSQCSNDASCQQYASTLKLGECSKVRCNQSCGTCEVYTTKKCGTCQETCKPNGCEKAECVRQTDKTFKCVKTPFNLSKCDDGKRCTRDSCENGKCKNVYDKTLPGCQCETEFECGQYATVNDLKNKCQKASCIDNKCVTVPDETRNCVTKTECDRECKTNPCRRATCIRKANGKVGCQYIDVNRLCDDGKICTKDYCDIKTGKCVNEYIENDKNCPKDGKCVKNTDCQLWGLKKNLDQCLDAVCDTTTGACKHVPNKKTCTKCEQCDKIKNRCASSGQVLKSRCSYDLAGQLVCEYTPVKCDDNNKCTTDSCDPIKGCVYIPNKCKTQKCTKSEECAASGKKGQSKCCETICDKRSNICRPVRINTPECNPELKKCQQTCKSEGCTSRTCRHSCKNPTEFYCEETPINCDDNNACTIDSCNAKGQCVNTPIKDDDKCKVCTAPVDCEKWAQDKNLDANCQEAQCVKNVCVVADVTSYICQKCTLDCSSKDKCINSKCVRTLPKTNNFKCSERTPTNCDDKKSCTIDSCDSNTGKCVNVVDKTKPECTYLCNDDKDCKVYIATNKINLDCKKVHCDQTKGACVTEDAPNSKCPESLCKVQENCKQSSLGTECCEENGVRKCIPNECNVDNDCNKTNKPGMWGYCKKIGKCSKAKRCKWLPVCKDNFQCDDNDPCTKDVCVKPYGFCKNIKRCVDNTKCTKDICVPSEDKKSFRCFNPPKTCTLEPTLYSEAFTKLDKEKQQKWLGKCSPTEGCITCFSNNQCDDGDGCTDDYCDVDKRICVFVPIHNNFCDPKLTSQSIKVQSYIDVLPFLKNQGINK